MGMEVRMVIEADGPTARRAGEAAFATIASLDARLSDYRPDSDLRAIERAAPDAVRVHPEVLAVLTRAVDIARASGGAFDPTLAPVVALWRDSRATGRLPSAGAIAAARALVGWTRLDLDEASSSVRLPAAGMRLDLGGIAKGYILQRALDTLREHGAGIAMIEAGGDVVVGEPRPGTRGWSVEIGCEGPGGGRLLIHNEALATSGASAQFVEIDGVRYSHVVDPQTGLGLTSHRTVHVRARDGATADGWATALGVLGPDRAAAIALPEGVQYCFAESDGAPPSRATYGVPRVRSTGAAARPGPP